MWMAALGALKPRREQVMQMTIDVANLTPSEADQLRRAMGSKCSRAKMERLRARFYEGAAANGVTGAVADTIYGQVEAFSGYGFPEAHSMSMTVPMSPFGNLLGADSLCLPPHQSTARLPSRLTSATPTTTWPTPSPTATATRLLGTPGRPAVRSASSRSLRLCFAFVFLGQPAWR